MTKTTPIADLDWDHLNREDRRTVIRIIGHRSMTFGRRTDSFSFKDFVPLVQQQILVAIKSATRKGRGR